MVSQEEDCQQRGSRCVDGDPVDGNDTWRREVRTQDSAEVGKLPRAVAQDPQGPLNLLCRQKAHRPVLSVLALGDD